MTFHVGQKVVCVNNGVFALSAKTILCVGQIYIINFMRVDALGNLSLWLDGVISGWDARRFRPIVSRKTDISIFTKMLTPQGVDA